MRCCHRPARPGDPVTTSLGILDCPVKPGNDNDRINVIGK
jgi:hypothetical protein